MKSILGCGGWPPSGGGGIGGGKFCWKFGGGGLNAGWGRSFAAVLARAIVPTITGQAWITGFASYVLDPTDPFPDGFTIGDIWA